MHTNLPEQHAKVSKQSKIPRYARLNELFSYLKCFITGYLCAALRLLALRTPGTPKIPINSLCTVLDWGKVNLHHRSLVVRTQLLDF